MSDTQIKELHLEIANMRKELLEMEQRRLATPPTPVAVPAPIVKTDDALVNELRREIAGLTANVNALERSNSTLRAENTDLRRKVDELTREVGILQGKLEAYKNRPVVTNEPPKIIYTTPPPAPAPVINYTPPAINYTPPASTPAPAPIINYTPPPAPAPIITNTPAPAPRIVYTEAPTRRIVEEPIRTSYVSGYDTYIGEETVIYFDLNKTMISESAKSKLSQVAEIVDRYEEATIDIRGYTDKTGSAAYNLELSRKRAIAVQDYLVNQLGLKPWQMLVYHFGEDQSSTELKDPSARKVVVTFTRK